jgi:hypothetical protein
MEDEMGGPCGTHGREDKFVLVFCWNPEGTRPIGRTRRRWGYIKLNFKATVVSAWTVFNWLRIETCGGAFCARW